MRSWFLIGLAALTASGASSSGEPPQAPGLATSYDAPRAFAIDERTQLEVELTDFSMERDGEPVQGFDGAGRGSKDVRHVLEKVAVREQRDGAPTLVLRRFEELEGGTTVSARGETEEIERDSPFEGALVRVEVVDGERTAEIVEGDGPEDDAALERFAPTLALDGLLPTAEVATGEAWELDGDAILAALGLDLEPVLFPEPEREPSGSGEGGDGERGDRRGGPRGPAPLALLAGAAWEGQATLAEPEDVDGVRCARIDLRFEARGELAEPEGGFGPPGRRERAPLVGAAPAAARESSYEAEIEGQLWFALDARHPLRLELKGELSLERSFEQQRGERSMSMHMEQSGAFERVVVVTEEAAEESQ